MAHLPDILSRIQGGGGWLPFDFEFKMENCAHIKDYRQSPEDYDSIWRHSIGTLLDSANGTISLMNDGLKHAGLQLEIMQSSRKTRFFGFIQSAHSIDETDIEASGNEIKPGHPQFSKILEKKLGDFIERRAEALTAWANSEGLTSPQLEGSTACGESEQLPSVHVHRDRQQNCT